MGGLRKKIPVTFAVLLCAVGGDRRRPPFTSGFFSKDEILWPPTHHRSVDVLGGRRHRRHDRVLRVGARSSCASSASTAGMRHPHESPLVMTRPLVVLAALSPGRRLLQRARTSWSRCFGGAA